MGELLKANEMREITKKAAIKQIANEINAVASKGGFQYKEKMYGFDRIKTSGLNEIQRDIVSELEKLGYNVKQDDFSIGNSLTKCLLIDWSNS